MKRILLVLSLALAACGPRQVALPSALPPLAVDTVAAAATEAPSATPIPALVILPDKFEKIAGVDEVPLPQDGPGVWRFYDQQAQVVCYIYGANRHEVLGVGAADFSWSGLSCLPVGQTALGK